MGWQFKRGTDARRAITVFLQGEPVFTVDTKKFYIGDGVTPGGILVGPGTGGETPTEGVMLKNIYDTTDNGIVDNSERLNNQLPSFYLNRTNHTGTIAMNVVDGLENALLGKQELLVSGTNLKTINGQSLLGTGNITISGGGSSSWGSITGDINTQTDLQTVLSSKAAIAHTHSISDVSGLQTALDGKQAAGSYAPASHSHIKANITDFAHTHPINEIVNLQTALDSKQATLVSGTNIKTINGTSVLGSGDLIISSGSSVNYINLKDYAIGDGITDDTTGIQNAFNQITSSGKTIIYVATGTYLISSTIIVTKSNFDLVMSGDAKFKFTSSVAGIRMFSIKGSNIIVRGGTFEGNWNEANYMDGPSNGGKITGQNLLCFVAENVSNFDNIHIDNCNFTLAGEHGLVLQCSKNTFMKNLKITNCKFISNWRHLNIVNSIDLVNGVYAWGDTQNIKIFDNYFKKTAAPPEGIFDSWSYGGNAITITGHYINCEIRRNVVEECGRMALEVFAGAHLDTGVYPKKLWITDNTLYKSRNRTFSICAEDAWVENNYIEDDLTFHEVGGYNHTYINNNFIGGLGVYVGRNAMPTTPGHRVGTRQYKFLGNTFRGMRKGASAIWAAHTTDVIFRDNEIIYDETSLDGDHDKKAVITVGSSYNCDFSDNIIKYKNTEIIRSFLSFTSNQLVKVNNNRIVVEDTCTLTDAPYIDASLVNINNCNKCEFIGNSIDIPFSVFMWDGIVYPLSSQLTLLKTYKWNGSTWDSTDILSNGLLNDPPASPVTDATYLIGDNPTGSWVGNARKLATWNGSAWVYITPKDIIWEVTNNAYAISNLPKSAALNDTYVAASGLISNIFKDNQWDKSGNVTFESGDGVYTIWATNSQGITYNNVWQNETKPKLVRGRIWYDKYIPYGTDYKNAVSEALTTPSNPTWGTITGSINTQSDLVAKFNTKMDALLAESYGVVGDGVTDNSTTIANAITAASGQNRPLFFKAGTYMIGANIVVPNNTYIIGEGDSTLFKFTNGTADNRWMFGSETAKSNIRFENIKLDGNKTNNTGANLAVIRFKNSTNIHINRCTIVDGGDVYGNVWLFNCIETRIKNSRFFETGGKHIVLWGGENISISGNYFEGWGKLNTVNCCISGYVTEVINCRVYDNTFKNTYGEQFAIEVAGAYMTQWIITNNTFIDNNLGGSGISGIFRNSIFGYNTFKNGIGSHRSGIEAAGFSNIAIGNEVEYGAIVLTTGDPVNWPGAGVNLQILDNRIKTRGTNHGGILFGNSSGVTSNVIVKNNIVDTREATGNASGIHLGNYGSAGQVNNVTIEGNIIYSVADGIRFQCAAGSSNIYIANNTVVQGVYWLSYHNNTTTNVRLFNNSSSATNGNTINYVATPTEPFVFLDERINNATQIALDTKVDENAAITPATKTKITYDSKGLVTAGTDLTETDIPTLSQSKITSLTTDLASKQATLVSGTNIKTVDGSSILGSGDLVTRNYPNFTTTYRIFTDFETGTAPFSNGTSNGTVAAASISVANRPGITYLGTSTNAAGRAWVNGHAVAYTFGSGTWSLTCDVHIPNLSTSTERYSLIVGFGDSTAAPNQTDGVYFLYDEGGVSTGSTASGNWYLVTCSNSVRTFTDSTVAIVANTWYRLKIEINADGTIVKFYINGTQYGGDVTSNIPTGTSRSTGPLLLLTKSIGTTTRVVNFDLLEIFATFTTPR